MTGPKTDTLNRRSRFARSLRGSSLRLAPRDVLILSALFRYRYLSSSLLHRFAGGSLTTLKWRLRDLFDADLLARPNAQWQVANAMHTPMLYELSTKGHERLEERGLTSGGPHRKTTGLARHFWHTVLVCQMMASVEIEVSAAPGCSFISESDILERLEPTGHLNPRAMPVGDKFVIPDGLFGVRTGRGVVLYALELDRGMEPLTRLGPGSAYREKFDQYRTLIGGSLYKSLLSTPAPLVVLHATTTESRVRSLMRLARSEAYHLFRSFPHLLEASMTRMPTENVLASYWITGSGSHFDVLGVHEPEG